MKRALSSLLVFVLLFGSEISFAQSSINRFLTPSDTLNKSRVWIVTGSWAAIYTGALIGLNELWYAKYPRSSFHFFPDGNEWLQMDKVGHAYTAYFESVWTTTALQWSGVDDKKSAWIGAATGFVFQATIEVMDGFSAEWGASPGDLTADFLGSTLSLSEYLLWNQQRIQLKFSTHPESYSADVSQRAIELYGTSVAQKVLKDYNGQTYWLSVNPSTFFKNQNCKFPKWLSIAAGYSADGMLGATSNVWEENGETVDRSDIPRLRQFYLAPDVDLTRIKTNSAFLKTFLAVANIIKFPAPAMEVSSNGHFKFYPIYF